METPVIESAVAECKTIAPIEVSSIEIPIATPVKAPLRSPDVVTAADVTATDAVPAITADFTTIAAAHLAAVGTHLGAPAAGVAAAGHIPAALNGCATATLDGGTAATGTTAAATNGCTAATTAATNGRTAASAAAATRAAVVLRHHHARRRKQRNGGQARKNFCTHHHVLLANVGSHKENSPLRRFVPCRT
jgi:hypothetical protein